MNYAIFKNEMIKTLKNDKIIAVKTPDMKIQQYWHRDYSQVDAVNGVVELGATMVEDDDESEYLDTPSKILEWARENGVKSNFEVVFISSNDRRFDYCEFKTNIGKNIAIVSDEMMSESHKSKENKMKKRYTKKQIMESIKYWQKQLNERYTRDGDTIYSDMSPGYGKDYNIANEIKLGQNAVVITIKDWKRDKMYPTRHVEKCATIQDLKNIHEKYGNCGLYITFYDDVNKNGSSTGLADVEITPIGPDDGDWWKREFGENADW